MTLRQWLVLVAVITIGWAAIFWGVQQRGRGAGSHPSDDENPSLLPAVNDSLTAAAAHILVAHAESDPPLPGVIRSADEALELAYRYSVLANERGADFFELARQYSDDPRAANTGGYLGILSSGRLPLEFEVALFNLEPDQIHPAVRTDQGYHVLKRLPIRLATARHILVTWDGSQTTGTRTNRTRNQARLFAEEVLASCRLPGADFCRLSSQYSDDAGTRFECGALGVIEPSATHPDFEFVLFRLRPGEISDLVETPFGFHIIQRLE